jgi:hypothetical protein
MNAFGVFAAAILLALSVANRGAAMQDARRFLDARLVPIEGEGPQDFAPRGWRIEEQVAGDLNGDRIGDAALRLVEDLPLEKDGVLVERFRALIVLFGREGGGYRRGAVATRLVYCSTCAGMLGDPNGANISLEIKNGVLNLMQLSGSREAVELTQRFRFDPTSDRFLLIGEDLEIYDRLNGEGTSQSTNYLTGLRITKKIRLYQHADEPRIVANRRTRVKPVGRFMEDVDYER